MEGIRTGKVSSIDYDNGMLKILYEDKDGAVTRAFPCLSMNGEYKMPKVGDHVLVLHLSNGAEAGVVMGTYWNEAVKSELTGEDVYRKELSNKPGKAYLQHKDGNFEMYADNLCFKDDTTTMTLKEIETRFRNIEKRLRAVELKVGIY